MIQETKKEKSETNNLDTTLTSFDILAFSF